jgi:hypothetical protein
MIRKSGNRFPACAKPWRRFADRLDASAGEARSEKIMLNQNAGAPIDSISKDCALASAPKGTQHKSLALVLKSAASPKSFN